MLDYECIRMLMPLIQLTLYLLFAKHLENIRL